MARIGKITPIKKEYSKEFGASLGTSLADKGMSMFPGSMKGIMPFKERNGEYRTGLDAKAIYIQRMGKVEAEQEIARVTALKEELERLTGHDLSTTSTYYTQMFKEGVFNSTNVASYVRLGDQPNIFNLSIPQEAITYAWLRVHPEIAPSYNAWKSGQSSYRCPMIASCQFFVDDEEYESEVAYTEKTLVNKAVNSLTNMSPTRQLKIAKLLNLPVSYNSKPELIYNELDNYIKGLNNKVKKSNNVATFNSISQMADENIEIRFRVKEALDFNVYRTGKGGKIYEGEMLVADSEDELIEYLTKPKNQEDYLALQKKIDNAKSIEV